MYLTDKSKKNTFNVIATLLIGLAGDFNVKMTDVLKKEACNDL